MFIVDLQGKFQPGLYTIMIAIYLNENYLNPDVRLVRYQVEGNL